MVVVDVVPLVGTLDTFALIWGHRVAVFGGSPASGPFLFAEQIGCAGVVSVFHDVFSDRHINVMIM